MKPRAYALTEVLARAIEAASAVQMIHQHDQHLADMPLMQRIQQAEQVLSKLKQEAEVLIEIELG